jgi:PAS domain S-box-containing protein
VQLSNPYGWLLIITTLMTAALFLFVLRRPKGPGVIPIMFMLVGVTIWTLGYGIQLFSTQLDSLLFWTKVVYIGVVTVSTSMLVFALEYTGLESQLPRGYALFLSIEPIVTLLLAWTNEQHELIQRDPYLVTTNGFVYLAALGHGMAFWLHIGYTYLILLCATTILVRAMVRSPHLYRGQVRIMLVAAFIPWVGNIIHLVAAGLPIDPTPLAFAFTGLALTFGINRFGLFNIIPVARDLVLESMEDALVVLDDLSRIVDANLSAQALLGSLAIDLAGKSGDEAFSSWRDQMAGYLGQGVVHGEVNLGSEAMPRWFALRGTPVRSRPDGVIIGQVLVFHDIQERKQAEEMMAEARDQALQASMVKSQLVANVSHDLRTPLNAILGFSEMLLEANYEPLQPRQSDIVRQMYNAAQQMSLFVSDLLDQSLIEKGKLTLYPTQFQPTELIAAVQTMFHRAALEKGLLLIFEIEKSLPETVWGDIKRLQQVLMNLVGNAIKFTTRGSVVIRLYGVGESWVLEVNDTGCGIPSEAHVFIFEPFRQVDGSPGRKQSGAGLGLAIVRHLVTMMGGHINLTSRVGEGSTFRVILPLAQPLESHVEQFRPDAARSFRESQ